MNLSPRDILKTVELAPVFQRKNIESGYFGIHVKWITNFANISAGTDGKARISTYDPSSHAWVYFSVLLDKYPELKLLKYGEQMNVEGKIIEIDGSYITLSECEIYFFSKEKISTSDDSPKQINQWYKNPTYQWAIGIGVSIFLAIITLLLTNNSNIGQVNGDYVEGNKIVNEK